MSVHEEANPQMNISGNVFTWLFNHFSEWTLSLGLVNLDGEKSLAATVPRGDKQNALLLITDHLATAS